MVTKSMVCAGGDGVISACNVSVLATYQGAAGRWAEQGEREPIKPLPPESHAPRDPAGLGKSCHSSPLLAAHPQCMGTGRGLDVSGSTSSPNRAGNLVICRGVL